MLDATYFPINNFTAIGTNQFAITDIVPQYDRQIIFKQDRTHYSYALLSGTTYEYPVFDLNEAVGNVAFNAVRLVENFPVSFKNHTWWRWSNTQVEDERNANIISDRISDSLDAVELSQAVTFDYQKRKELWVNIDSTVYIWNYEVDAFYMFNNIKAVNYDLLDGAVAYGGYGTYEVFSVDKLNDNGVAIESELELAFNDFGRNELQKNSRKIWTKIQPETRTGVNITWETDVDALEDADAITEVRYDLIDFNDIDFNNFSFLTNRSPQTFRSKIQAKKYSVIKFIFKNSATDERLTIVSLKVEAQTTGEVR